MGKNTDQPGLEQLEKERFRIITDIIYYAAGHVDRMDFKYGVRSQQTCIHGKRVY